MILDFINPLVLFITLFIGIFITYTSTSAPEIIYLFPTPDMSKKINYRDNNNNCYKYLSEEVNCKKFNSVEDIPANIN